MYAMQLFHVCDVCVHAMHAMYATHATYALYALYACMHLCMYAVCDVYMHACV